MSVFRVQCLGGVEQLTGVSMTVVSSNKLYRIGHVDHLLTITKIHPQ